MNYINQQRIKEIIKQALKEDIGKKDITTAAIITKDKYVKAILLAKENAVLCGLSIADEVFKTQDKNIKFKALVPEGQRIKRGKIIAWISGKAQNILTAERVALNFLSLLSGIATRTRAYVDRVKPYKVKIMDTRKTIPGLRELEKYAVKIGGGYNHRMRLDGMVLIKDNHLKALGGIKKINKVKTKGKIEIEVKNLKEFKEAMRLKPDIIMLDNMSVNAIRKAVKIRNRLSPKIFHPIPSLEASGGISLKNVKKIAATAVEMISIGALTHSPVSVDISLEIL